ncbi:LysR substrate-binding domain-containing protein [Massilia terrae]|uniref:LysR family transcriptional regulator n=1 Tax=Massilia terrae TaxID=1811224 RepID=A0ABT2CYI3_9BURK|nr:LysR family transcriptional regulator [Massilia terrae]MCS0658235.1 LysR family transcriptional regulator [Massilia terrae]
MTLKQLEAFYWAATCANFAIAAERLHLSVSSLSKRIAELEESLGQPLFDRGGHRAVLTEAGQGLLPRALELLDGAAAIRHAFAPGAGLVGRCVFGVGELSAMTWLPRFIAQVRAQYPKLVLEPYVNVGAVLESRVDNGELDFAIVAGRSSRQTVLSQPITQAQFVWMATPALVERYRDLGGMLRDRQPIIALPPGAGTTRLIDDWLLAHGIASVERISCNNWGAIAGMLIASVGVGILPEGWARKLVQEKLLCILADEQALTPLTYSFQWRRGDSRPLVSQMLGQAASVADFSADARLPLLV